MACGRVSYIVRMGDSLLVGGKTSSLYIIHLVFRNRVLTVRLLHPTHYYRPKWNGLFFFSSRDFRSISECEKSLAAS